MSNHPALSAESPLTREPSDRKVRADAIAIIVMSALAAISVITLAVQKFRELITPEGISWRLPVEPATATAEGLRLYTADGPAAAETVSGASSQLTVLIPDLGAFSTASFVASIAFATLTALAVIACTARLAWVFLRGRFFTVEASRALRTLTYTGAFGGAVAFICWRIGASGIEKALGVRAMDIGTASWWSWYAIVLFAVTAFGLVDIALRRGIRLQRETEGLV